MANTSAERLKRWKRKAAQRALIGSADGEKYHTDARCARAAKLGAQLAKSRDKSVTEERLAGVLAARRRRRQDAEK